MSIGDDMTIKINLIIKLNSAYKELGLIATILYFIIKSKNS